MDGASWGGRAGIAPVRAGAVGARGEQVIFHDVNVAVEWGFVDARRCGGGFVDGGSTAAARAFGSNSPR
jgi:hypothetical protein